MALFPTVSSGQYTIRTASGGGPPDGIPGTQAGVSPNSIATDQSGNVYIPSIQQQAVFRLSTSGILTTVAGTGAAGSAGESVPANSASLNLPNDVAVDAAGNIFISDSYNYRVRKVSTTGAMTTVPGFPLLASNQVPLTPRAIAIDSSGNLYVSTWSQIFKVSAAGVRTLVAGSEETGYSGDGGPATAALLGGVNSMSFDPQGNLYIAEPFIHRIRKISVSGTITTVAGIGQEGFSGDGGMATGARLYHPHAIAVDASGNIFITDTSNSRIRRVHTDGIITTIAGNGFAAFTGDGPATVASLYGPKGIAVDASGVVYIADTGNSRLRKLTPDGMLATVAGNGTLGRSGDNGAATLAQLSRPAGVAAGPSGSYYIADTSNSSVRRVSASGSITTVAGTGFWGDSGDGGLAIFADVAGPAAIRVDTSGNVYIGGGLTRVRKVSPGGVISTFAGTGAQGFSGDGGPAVNAQLNFPKDFAIDTAGNVFIADQQNHRIRRVSVSGIITTIAGSGSRGFAGDGGAATSAKLNYPSGIALDSEGNLYISDTDNYRIRKVSMSGIITTVAGNGVEMSAGDGGPAVNTSLNHPYGLAVDNAGNIFVSEWNRIRKIAINGTITTIAGTGAADFSGDGGPALNASLHAGAGLAIDNTSGVLYIADTESNRIRTLTPPVSVQPAALTFTSKYGGPAPSDQPITLLNAGTVLSVEYTSGQPWLFFGRGVVSVYLLGNVYAPNTYTGNIRITTTNGVVNLPVTWIVTPCTQAPAQTTFAIPSGGGSDGFVLSATPGCAWTAATNVPWITITSAISGSGPAPVVFRVDPNTGVARTGIISVTGFTVTISQGGTIESPSGLRFVPTVPCRAADTRTNAAARMAAGETRIFTLPSTNCGIPSDAVAYSLNVTVVPSGTLAYLTLGPAGQARPLVSTLNSFDGRIKSNAAMVPAGSGSAISVYVTDSTDVILDVNGYFTTVATNALTYFPLDPCRVADTRSTASLAAGVPRTFAVAGTCGIPASAQAYSLNLTAVPPAPLGFLTVWPAGIARPLASTLNAMTGTVVANAAIVPAGTNGSIDIFATDPTHVVIDVNGYFAPAASLTFHTLPPCRIVDTRSGPSMLAGQTRTFGLPGTACNIPATAKAYSLNVTAVPSGPLSYLTIWPASQPQPFVSTLNSFDGAVVSNAALVPAGAAGAVSVFVTHPTHVILDINGYFQ